MYTTLFETKEATLNIPPITLKHISDAARVKKLFRELACELYQFISVNVTVELIYAEKV